MHAQVDMRYPPQVNTHTTGWGRGWVQSSTHSRLSKFLGSLEHTVAQAILKLVILLLPPECWITEAYRYI